MEILKAYEASGLTPVAFAEHLKETLGIRFKVYEDDGLILLDYNQIESPKTHPIVMECRSLIVALEDFSVVSRKFRRFFNVGEAVETLPDGFGNKHFISFEKADGSIIGVYYNPCTWRWEISTRGQAKGEMEFAPGETWRDKVLAAFGLTEDEFQNVCSNNIPEDVTYIFEFTSPENRIVTPYEKAEMVLLDSIDTNGKSTAETLAKSHHLFISDTYELEVSVLSSLGLKCRPPRMNCAVGALADLIEEANKLSNLEEGFVVMCAATGHRVKIKSKEYLVAHKLRGENAVPTRKNILSLIFEAETDEFLAYFPEYTDLVNSIRTEITNAIMAADAYYEAIKHIEHQREFAYAVNQCEDSSFKFLMFNARRDGVTVEQAFNSLPNEQKMKVFK